ncbi:MAG TPA: ATP-binding protein [Bryobacteraceae bacterium]|jgi:heavy metal sensor kinase|nr:ATP-binding protein [Bryobacteraceae bacterium]
MRRRGDLRRIARGLRFQLTASFALFFAVMLIAFTGLFRERLIKTLNDQSQELLNQEWSTMKGYMHIDRVAVTKPLKVYWIYDASDPDETNSVTEIQKVYLVADANGHAINEVINDTESNGPAESSTYEDLGGDPPAVITKRVRDALAGKPNTPFFITRYSKSGEPFLIRYGLVYDDRHANPAPFYVAIGTSLSNNAKILNGFTWIYAGVFPASVILGLVLGWIVAGRALRSVRDVAQAAQRITGSNLSLRIPSRQAGDELDYLILTFNRMTERLEASFQQIKQFSTDVSHELRTPITAIRGQLEVALFTAKTVDHYREAMFNALQDIDRLSQIVRALLLLSQAESGQLALQKSRLNLCRALHDLVDQFQIPAEAAAVHLSADLPVECYADVDRVQIDRMVTNLLSNAIKFTPEKGHVFVRLRPRQDRVEIVVEDTGKGIPVEHLPHIFDRFYRVPGSGTAPSPEQGLGLGLSFVAWIVRAHDGKIDVKSEPGKGTCFTISLPGADVPAGAIPEVVEHA